jgi:type I restriction enzyme S subunit
MQTLKLTKKYEKYPEYKYSGVAWLGKIPKGWEPQKLQYLFEIKKRIIGKIGPSILSITQRGIKVKNIESNDGQLSSDYSKYQIVEKNDFAMNHMDLLTGYVDISQYEGVVSPDYRVFSLRNDNNIDRYFLYLFQIGYLLKIFYAYGRGAAQFGRWRLPANEFKSFVVSVPTESEQKRIVNYLDKKISFVDQVIEKKQKQIEFLKEEIVSIAMNEQVNGKGKTIRIGNLFKLADKPISLEDYSEYTALGLYNRGRGLFHKEPQLGKDIKESDFYRVIPKDLIISGQFAWEGAVALAGKDENECVVSHRYYLLRDGVVKTEYFLALLMTKYGDHLLSESSRGSAGRNKPLNIKVLLKEKIRVPAKNVEEKIESLLIKMRSIQSNIKNSVNLLEEYKCSLISNVVTGKIKV